MWASNFSHVAFSNVFASLISKQDLDIGYSVWHTIQGDKGQREAMAAAAKATLPANSRILRNLLWAKKKADDLATIRNDAAHMATAWSVGAKPFELIANPVNNPRARLDRLQKTADIRRSFGIAKGDLYQLGAYVHDLFCHVAFPDDADPMPRRPVLKARRC